MSDLVFATYDFASGLAASRPAAPAPANGRLYIYQATDTGDVSMWNVGSASWAKIASTPGTVTSVAMTVPAEFSIGGSPITTSGTLAITKATQSANTVWAGPTTGSAAAPTFRALVSADLPNPVLTDFTPTVEIGGSVTGITYSIQEGYYMLFGGRCFCDLIIALTSKGIATGLITISLPVVVNDTGTNIRYGGLLIIQNTTLGLTGLFNTCAPGASSAVLWYLDPTSNTQQEITDTFITNTSVFRLSINYPI